MVEEFMLLANISVAAEITRAFPQVRAPVPRRGRRDRHARMLRSQCAMLRRHPPPSPGAFDSLQRPLGLLGLELDTSSSLALGKSLDACVRPDDKYFNQLARILATRSMQQARRLVRSRRHRHAATHRAEPQARYFCSGNHTPADYAHYGLACPIYTHFTSPIRRYSDQARPQQ